MSAVPFAHVNRRSQSRWILIDLYNVPQAFLGYKHYFHCLVREQTPSVAPPRNTSVPPDFGPAQ